MQTTVADELEKNFLEKYQLLNPEQKEAVDTTEGPVMVIAGPGTGKTQILAMRIANILRNPDLQVNPSNILCLTFTESGVSAMRNRLISIIGEAAYYVRIHTFHSFCNEIIKDNPHKFFSINPISELEQIGIFNEIIESLEPTSPIKPFGDPYIYRRDLIHAVKTLKRESVSPEELLNKTEACESFIKKNASLIEAFIARNARSIKDHDCEEFIEHLHIANPDSEYLPLFRDFWAKATKSKEFKDPVKDFYEKNLKEIPKQKELVNVYHAYEHKLKVGKLYDFEDMILRVISQFKHDDELLGVYQEQFQYILVDEFQDTNGAQNKILEYLSAHYQENPNLFVVGDDDQSIYRFQGASVENIVHFLKRYQTYGKRIVLKNNYRSQQKILDTAQRSIDNNDSRISKLISNISKQLSSSGMASSYALAPVEVHRSPSLQDEIFHIATTIKELVDNGTQPGEIAILFRENKEAIPLMDYFSRLGVNASFEAGENILEDIEICQLIDLLKIIERPERSDLLFNILNYDFVFESKLFRDAGITAIDIFRVNEKRRSQPRAEEPKAFIHFLIEDDKFKSFAEKIIEINKLSMNVRADDLLERVIKEFNFLDYSLKQPDYIQRINKLESLFNEVRGLIDSPVARNLKRADTLKTIQLSDLIKHIELIQKENLRIKAKALNLESNAVRLMTAHKSKGLEFEHVFIHSCLDKRWGNKANRSKLKLPPLLLDETESLLSNEANEDERRLFFVALTRARHKAYIHYHAENVKGQETVPSLFISELLGLSDDVLIEIENPASEEDLKERFKLHFSDRIDNHIAEEKAYLDSLLENYKLSVTHLNNFLKCKRKFFYQNLLRVPAAKSKHASFGTAIHEALYELYSSSSPSLEYLLESFNTHLEKQRLTENEHTDCLGIGNKTLTEYFNKYWQESNKNVLLEYDFSGLGVNIDGVTLTGKLDKVEILDSDDKTVLVIDYKTGNPSNKGPSLKPGGDYHRQIVFYQLLCDLAKAKAGFKYEMVAGEIDFVQQDSYNKYVKKKITVENTDLEILKAEIKDMYSDITAHNFIKTEDLSECDRCDYKNICGR